MVKPWPIPLLPIETNENGTVRLTGILYENENTGDAANLTLDSIDIYVKSDSDDGGACDIDVLLY